ncbi:radical SAM protein [Candidatus Uhrbacteria bacterium]|nr:radical SAM protein [Candidatus Uhrbacteria bacterium]
MRIQTFSIVVGTRACNARCPFCVSRMTGFDELPKRGQVYRPNFEKACELAKLAGTTTVLMTGKGEPTLYPDEVSEYLELLRPYRFPLIEIQTNALDIGWLVRDGKAKHAKGLTREVLASWRANGLNTIAISVVSEKAEHNAKVYNEDYPDLTKTIAFLHELGFTVRLCVMMQKDAVDTPERVADILAFCRANGIEQLTIRPIRKPKAQTHDGDASGYVTEHGLDDTEIAAISDWVTAHGTTLLSLMHGAAVYDIGGQNCCLSDCLTVSATSDDIRTLIFYSDGRVTYDWQYDGAVILRGVGEEARRQQPLVQLGTPTAR